MEVLTEDTEQIEKLTAFNQEIIDVYNEVKRSTMAYRFGAPREAHKEVSRCYGIPFYYSRETNLLVFAEQLRYAQIAAKRG